MNSLTILSLILSSIISVTFASSLRSSSVVSSKKCSRELEEIIYKPETCTFLYMQSLERKFRAGGQVIFGPEEQADAYIYTFEKNYGVTISLQKPFGNSVIYNPDGTKTEGSPEQYAGTAQSYLNFPGFVKSTSSSEFYYHFNEYSPDARFYGVTIIMPLANEVLSC